ncbi:MAG: Na(+)/H(+) antiporter subunit D [Rhodospirillales bacterium]|nr:Na(+)/H(+) antiporter subunit D [Rhodospirillales bacterium]
MTSVAPFLVFLVGAALVVVTRGWLRNVLAVATPVVAGVNLLLLGDAEPTIVTLVGQELILVQPDRLSMLFGWLFTIATFIAMVYGLHQPSKLEQTAGLAYAASTMGAVFAGDLLTLLLFWEGLGLTSVFLILARRTPDAEGAAMRYMMLQVLSGLLMIGGIAALASQGESLVMHPMELEGLAAWLILMSLGIKAGFPLLHNWITDTYPKAPVTGTVLMSALTTKTSIYCLATMFPGTELLIYIGAAMTLFPIFYAVIEDNLRRVLSYSLLNQLGFMITGIGIGTELSINGAAAHAFAHVLYKSLLFMSMGAVLFRTGKMGATELGGLYRTMPRTTVLCIIGAASISAFPLFSGFVAKAMVMSAALKEGHDWVWIALLFASAGVLHHAGIKIPFFAFFNHDSGLRPKEAPMSMLIAMAIAAVFCIGIGVFPRLLYEHLPYPVTYAPYTVEHVLTQMQLLLFAALCFVVLRLTKLEPPERAGVNVDAEWSYRWLLPRAVRLFRSVLEAIGVPLREAARSGINGTIGLAMRWHGPQGLFARDPVISTASLVVIVLFGLVLIMQLIRGF